jgi:putative hydrolase of the HAD superfamily
MPYSTLFFDLDDTLYPNTNGLWSAIRERMGVFMRERLDLPPEDIPNLRRTYFETYGTTLRGLQIHHQVDASEYLAYVHDLPLDEFLNPDPVLRAMLLDLPQRKWVFTNADSDHAERVLATLGLSDCFAGIVDVRALGYLCKPDVKAYYRALSLTGENDPRQCILLDDAPRNLEPARGLGFTTVLVGSQEPHPSANYSIPCLKDLPQVMPQLYEYR